MKRFRLIFSLLLFFCFFLFFFLPTFDPDLGWHLRCGQLFWQEHDLCNINRFTVLLADYQWVNMHLLYQITIYPLFKNFGLMGLSIFGALVAAITFLLLNFLFTDNVNSKTLAILLTTLASLDVYSLGIRSQVTSMLFFVLTLIILKKSGYNKNLLFFLPFLMFFWVNSHGSFVLEIITIFAFLLAKLPLLRKKNQKQKFPLFIFMIFTLTFLMSLFNPYGLKVYLEAWQHISMPLNNLIAEWVPPNLLHFLIISVSFLVITAAFVNDRKRLFFEYLLVFIFAVLAIKARRNLPFFYISLSLYLLPLSKYLKDKISNKILLSANIFILVTFFLLGIKNLFTTSKILSGWDLFCQKSPVHYPCEAAVFLKNKYNSGNIYNAYEWGGFLIWQLPEYKIFVDGRMPAWSHPSGKSPYTLYLDIIQAKGDWDEKLKTYNIDFLLIQRGTFLDLKLQPNPATLNWHEVYRDKIAVVYKRS